MHLSLSLLAAELTRVQFLVFPVHRTAGMKEFSKGKRNVSTRTPIHSGKSQYFESRGEAKRYTSFVITVWKWVVREIGEKISVWLFELSRCSNNCGFEKSWFYRKVHYLTREFRARGGGIPSSGNELSYRITISQTHNCLNISITQTVKH